MPNKQALTSQKKRIQNLLAKRMLELQKKFIDRESSGEIAESSEESERCGCSGDQSEKVVDIAISGTQFLRK